MKGRVVFLTYVMSLILSSEAGFTATDSSGFSRVQQLLPVPDLPIHISVMPHEVLVNASMRPGTYPIAEPLHLQVASRAPGWYVQMYATNLKSKEDEISSEEIHLMTKQGTASLNQPQIVLETNQGGEVFPDVLLELRTTRRHKPGTYVGELFLMAGYLGWPPSEIIKLAFEAEVTCSISGSIQGNKMYFHYGLPGEHINATANGEIAADTDVSLSLSVMQGRIDSLPMLRSVSSQNRCEDSFIPLIWELRHNGADWREPDNISFDGGEISWELAVDSKKVYYELQCSPRPDSAQAPGDYGMSIVLTVKPIL
jgi:hypothetical protein